MFDVRIQKSESNKGNESGKSTGERGKENVPDKAKEIARQVRPASYSQYLKDKK